MFERIIKIFFALREEKRKKFNRVLPFGDYFSDRQEKAKYLGFGDGATVYDNVVIIGDVTVSKNTWIGPNVILDGSGVLEIGSNCSISAGVQIYSHDSVKWAISGGKKPYVYEKTIIKDNCYIGPNVIISKGVTIGECTMIGANSFVKSNIAPNSVAYGNPAKVKEN